MRNRTWNRTDLFGLFNRKPIQARVSGKPARIDPDNLMRDGSRVYDATDNSKLQSNFFLDQKSSEMGGERRERKE